MDIESQRQQVARALGALETGIARLVNAIAHGTATVELAAGDDARDPIARACEAYSAIDYRMEDEVDTSVVCLGVLGVSADILRRAESVNALKANLKEICAPLHGVQIRIAVKGEDAPTKKISAMRVVLRNIQRSDLNLLAAYRKIPILEGSPTTITYTRANTRSVYRKTIEDLYVLLNTREGPTASADRARLSTLDRRETHLALVKERYQNIRANILYRHLDARGRGRIQIAAELPLLYPNGRRAEPPEVRFPQAVDADEPRRTRQSKFEPLPFLEALPVYRYARPAR